MPHKYFSSVFLSVFASINITACSWFAAQEVGNQVKQDQSSSLEARTQGSESKEPFNLNIVEELNDGNNLHLRGNIISYADWPLENLSIKTIGYTNGEEKLEKVWPLQNLLSDKSSFSANQMRDFVVSIPAIGLTDYQLELSWSGKALASAANKQVNPLSGLVIKDLQYQELVDTCLQGSCPTQILAKGLFFNPNQQIISSATLGIGWILAGQSKLDLRAQIPENEELLEISDLNLLAGQAREFAIEISKPHGLEQVNKYQASMRVIASR